MYTSRRNSNYPSYQGMVLEALFNTNEYRTERQIRDHIVNNYNLNDSREIMNFYVRRAINKLIDGGYVVRDRNMLMLTQSGRNKYLNGNRNNNNNNNNNSRRRYRYLYLNNQSPNSQM